MTTIATSLKYLLLKQLRVLQNAGYEVVGISSYGEGVQDLEEAGIRHVAVEMSRTIGDPIGDARAFWKLYRVFREQRFTIVHTHTPKASVLGQIAARLAGIPIVVNTLHGLYAHDGMSKAVRKVSLALETLAFRCADLVLSQNQEDIDTIAREGACSADRVAFLGNGIDISVFDPERVDGRAVRRRRQELRIPEGTRVVGFVGRLAGRRKGFIEFLKAGREVTRRGHDVRFLVVGAPDVGKGDAVSPEVAKDYGIWERCRFVGWRQNEEMPELYRMMDVLVLPSLFEGLPRAVMEASAMGVPAVVTDVKGNREAVEHGRNGLLVPLQDTRALAEAIEHILSHPEIARRMAADARRLALERFDERVVFDRVLRQYAALLERKGLQAPTETC